MSTETTVSNLKINKVTKAQYDTITKSSTEAYEITDLGSVLDGKQATLVSGTNIKTINNTSLLGSGNISISGGSATTVKINGTSITSSGVADIKTNGTYNATSNKIATMSDVPAAQVNSDWNASSGVAKILNKPSLATVATSGSYNDLSNKPTIPTVNNATLTITQGGTTKGTFTANASSNVTIDVDAGGGSSRNIGEIVASTIPLTDAGLHLLDGALIQRASYSDFVDYIASIYSANANYFCSESDWQTSVTNYGVCGKFVYNSTNNTVRLPKITGFVEGASGTATLGDVTEAGLPNITAGTRIGDISGVSYPYAVTGPWGAFYSSESNRVANVGTNSVTGYDQVLNLDASRSSSIYGNSSTVQPQTIKVLYYIVIATSTKTDIQVDIDEIATDLNGKADIDLNNLSVGLANTICTTPATTTSTASSATPAVVITNYVNGTSWYRIWSDGWCEQGGLTASSATSSGYINLMIEMKDTNYFCQAYYQSNDTGNAKTNYGYCGAYSTTQILVGSYSKNNKNSWEVKGYKK